jgi:hypothetical protein
MGNHGSITFFGRLVKMPSLFGFPEKKVFNNAAVIVTIINF